MLRANAIQGTLVFDDLVHVPKANISEIQMLQPGDIVVAASSGSAALVGKAAQLNHEWNGSFGAFCFGLRPTPLADARFLGWFLQTKEYRQRVSTASAGTNINNLRAMQIEETPIRVPPVCEQRRIADTLDELFSELDAGIAALERARAKLKLYRASVLKAAVEGALTADWRAQHPDAEPASELLKRILTERRRRWETAQLRKFKEAGKPPPKNWKARYKEPVAPNTSNLPTLPQGWCWATVEQLSAPESNSITDGPFGSNLMTSHYTEEGPRVVRLQNIKDGGFADEHAHISEDRFAKLKKHQVFGGDIVIAALGENLPRVCIVPDTLGLAIVKADCIRFQPYSRSAAKCLCFFLNALPTRVRTKHVVHGIGRPRMNLGEIREIAIPLAPTVEQEQIEAEADEQLSALDHLEADLDAKLKNAQALRQSILRDAFAGKLVSQDPNDEPASVLLERIAAARVQRESTLKAAKKAKPKPKATRTRARKTKGKTST